MNHEKIEALLPLYAAGQLEGREREMLEAHLLDCAQCQEDLRLWQAVSGEIMASSCAVVAPPELAGRALERSHTRSGFSLGWLRVWQLLRAQAYLVQREMWPAAMAVMALGVVGTLVSGRTEIFYFLAPLVAAATLAMLSGPENDPACELTTATPTSAWKVLLARLSIVSAFNLSLALAAVLVLTIFTQPGLFSVLALGWLAPMAFLSTLALLLSTWLGSGNAIFISYALWIAQYIPYQSLHTWMASPAWEHAIASYQRFWQNPLLLLALSSLLLGIALWSAGRPVLRLGVKNG